MMEQIAIREANRTDSEEIVELLKVALGEDTEKSVDNWLWKHYQNPFGESKVYVATINNEIVGVRAFMQWRWIDKTGQILKAVRAVDTSVSPNHRRKGIFLKLTNHALQKVKEEGFHFIFNTPNDKSIGGYLKLGWVLNRKIPVNLIINPFFWLRSTNKLEEHSIETAKLVEQHQSNFFPVFKNAEITCPFSKEYFQWRYVNNPLATYGYTHVDKEVLVIYRLKKTKNVTECRIVDIQFFNADGKKKLKKAIFDLIKRYPVVSIIQDVITSKVVVGNSFAALSLKRTGPNMVTKNVNLSLSDYEKILDANSSYWGFNLGDMELF